MKKLLSRLWPKKPAADTAAPAPAPATAAGVASGDDDDFVNLSETPTVRIVAPETVMIETFFDRQVQSMHDAGDLKTYDTPQGTAQPGWKPSVKEGHATPGKDTPGLAWHKGDETYNAMTTANIQQYHAFELGNEAIQDKLRSLRAGIKAYMPDEAFAEFLEHFKQHLDDTEYRGALLLSYSQMHKQLNGMAKLPISRDKLQEMVGGEVDPVELRVGLVNANMHRSLEAYPEMLLTMAIYHAAHRCYVAGLKRAIDRSTIISEDERDNANYTLNTSSFHQFTNFLLFNTMLPLTILHYEERGAAQASPSADTASTAASGAVEATQSSGRCPISAILRRGPRPASTSPGHGAEVDNDAMKKAMHKAWQTFFEKSITTRRYDDNGMPPPVGDKPVAKMTCPAKEHLRAAMKGNTLESLYDFVQQNKNTSLKDAMDQAREAAKGAVEPLISQELGDAVVRKAVEQRLQNQQYQQR